MVVAKINRINRVAKKQPTDKSVLKVIVFQKRKKELFWENMSSIGIMILGIGLCLTLFGAILGIPLMILAGWRLGKTRKEKYQIDLQLIDLGVDVK